MDGVYSNVGAVVGATYPEMGRILPQAYARSLFLVPGYGAQGGTADDLKHCFNEDGWSHCGNSSRGIIAALSRRSINSSGRSTLAEHPDRPY